MNNDHKEPIWAAMFVGALAAGASHGATREETVSRAAATADLGLIEFEARKKAWDEQERLEREARDRD